MSGPKMWPAPLPKEVRDHPLRQAEVKVYDQLQAQLGPDWTVFYSRPWLGLTPSGEEKDGECDFVVVHPRHGFLAIEVKGGGITYDPGTDVWISEDRRHIRRRIKNPVEQARSSKHELLKKLKAQRRWPAGLFVRMRHGVIFPDALSPPSNLGPDRPRTLFCCQPDMADLGAWVLGRLSGGSEQPMGKAGVEVFEQLLAQPFVLKAPLAHFLDEDDSLIATLTPQQFYILDAIQDVQRAAVGGGAGTGKTIVAMEDAIRLSGKELRTILTCLSQPLADHLKERLSKTGVTVLSFADLCDGFAREAGLAEAAWRSDEVAVDRLLKAVDADPSLRPDALIVDEAQDFPVHWWVALDGILSAHPGARLHAFYDTNQKVYGAVKGQLSAFQLVPISLTRNFRNTQLIHAAASRFYEGLPVTADGPEGTPVVWTPCGDQPLESCIERIVRGLVTGDTVAPVDIVVVAAGEAERDALRVSLRRFVQDGLLVETIAAFKGLERQVVVLAAGRSLVEHPELVYVALSRARAHLVIAGEADVLNWISKPSGPLVRATLPSGA